MDTHTHTHIGTRMHECTHTHTLTHQLHVLFINLQRRDLLPKQTTQSCQVSQQGLQVEQPHSCSTLSWGELCKIQNQLSFPLLRQQLILAPVHQGNCATRVSDQRITGKEARQFLCEDIWLCVCVCVCATWKLRRQSFMA